MKIRNRQVIYNLPLEDFLSGNKTMTVTLVRLSRKNILRWTRSLKKKKYNFKNNDVVK